MGEQAELWVSNVRDALARKGRVETKAPKPFLREQSFYVEYKCRGRDGVWRPSGISVTKADLMMFTFGSLPGGLVVETEWLKRAVKLAWKNKLKRRECSQGSNPTKAVVVSLSDLWVTRDREP